MWSPLISLLRPQKAEDVLHSRRFMNFTYLELRNHDCQVSFRNRSAKQPVSGHYRSLFM